MLAMLLTARLWDCLIMLRGHLVRDPGRQGLTAAGPYVVLEAEPGDVIASLRGSMMTAERTCHPLLTCGNTVV
jgi:hypothetical protein